MRQVLRHGATKDNVLGLTVVLHAGTASLWAARPLLPAAWIVTAPAARRYLAGWAGGSELHLLAPAALDGRASKVHGSRERVLVAGPVLLLLATAVGLVLNDREGPSSHASHRTNCEERTTQ